MTLIVRETQASKILSPRALGATAQAVDSWPAPTLSSWTAPLLPSTQQTRQRSTANATPPIGDLAAKILRCVFRDNRVLPGVHRGLTPASEERHRPLLDRLIQANRPVELVLPGFPAKAPNPNKVLGPLPDLGEALALRRLGRLVDEIAAIYPPGAHLTICSDGHVFADLVGVADSAVEDYKRALLEMVDHPHIGWFDLTNAYGETSPDQLRNRLLRANAISIEELHRRAQKSTALSTQINGIHRFLMEDESARHPSLSRTQARNQTRPRAYEAVRRSDAWSALVSEGFPNALRLSIHPQPDPSPKIGVNLLNVKDPWLTPWHGVVFIQKGETQLVHRVDAQAMGGRVVMAPNGRPSHMEVI
ncbi:MAG: isocyanide synthase family protein [Polyangiaceae bacterium]|nr:isocyanide synthase family protein [Polyangiaceae bacterium]